MESQARLACSASASRPSSVPAARSSSVYFLPASLSASCKRSRVEA